MISVNIICIGSLKEKYFKDAVLEYSKRLSAFCKFKIVQLDEHKLPQNPSESEILQGIDIEGEKIKSKISKNSYVISMCIEGQIISSEKLASQIQDVSLQGISNIDFIIGGSFGLSNEIKNLSNFRLSMSKMTFPHQLARVMLCEQVYRAFQISSGGKYHK